MLIYNKDKTEILTDYDLSKGYLKEDTLIKQIPEQKEVPEQYHYEIINKSKDGASVKRIVDIPAVKYIPAHEETEKIQIYIPYSKKELERINNQKTLNEYETWFNNYFDMQCKQHSWQTDFVPSYDEYFDNTYNTWEELCVKAQIIREEINRIRELLSK